MLIAPRRTGRIWEPANDEGAVFAGANAPSFLIGAVCPNASRLAGEVRHRVVELHARLFYDHHQVIAR